MKINFLLFLVGLGTSSYGAYKCALYHFFTKEPIYKSVANNTLFDDESQKWVYLGIYIAGLFLCLLSFWIQGFKKKLKVPQES